MPSELPAAVKRAALFVAWVLHCTALPWVPAQHWMQVHKLMVLLLQGPQSADVLALAQLQAHKDSKFFSFVVERSWTAPGRVEV